MNNTSKIFTESEFNERVKMYWNLMVEPEFPDNKCPLIEHDREKRRTNNFAKVNYKPIRISFSYRMLDGRFILEHIDDVIKHEIGHLLAYFRYGKRQGHNANFKKIAREFGFNGTATFNIKLVEGFKEEILNKTTQDAKYRVYCTKCDREWFKNRKSGLIDRPIDYTCPCKVKKSLKVEVL